MILKGTADVILSLEPLEALRNIPYVNKKTKVITDINPIFPFTVDINRKTYPNLNDIFKEIQNNAILYIIDALFIGKNSGSAISKNIVMLGALSATDILPFDSKILLEIILDNTYPVYKDINKKAFRGGMKIMNKIRDVSNF